MRSGTRAAALALGFGCAFGHIRTFGQGFNKRYDPLGQGEQQGAWAIERLGSGYLTIGATPVNFQDTAYYDPILFSQVLDADGSVLVTDSFFYPLHAIYPGTDDCMDQALDGSYFSGGGTYAQSGTQRVALWKIDLTGNITMLAEYGDEGYEQFARQAIQAKDGGFLLVGESNMSDIIDVGVFKFDAAGMFEWSRTYGKPNLFDFGYMADTTLDDGFFIGARTGVTMSDNDFWVLRLAATGDTVWTKQWGTPYEDAGALLSAKSNGNPLISGGWPYAPELSQVRAYQAELDEADGSFVWQREYGPINAGYLFAAKEVAPGAGHIAVGYQNYAPSTYAGNLLRTADNGDSLWMRNYFYVDSLLTDGEGVLYDVITTLDGGFIACGTALGSVSGNLPPGYTQDAWVVKVDSLGCIIPGCDDISTVITVQATNLKDALAVYPNPAHGSTTVKVTLPRSSPFLGELRLRMVSAQGQEVIDQQAVQGENQLSLRDLAGGVYYVHLTSGSTWLSGAKLIIE